MNADSGSSVPYMKQQSLSSGWMPLTTEVVKEQIHTNSSKKVVQNKQVQIDPSAIEHKLQNRQQVKVDQTVSLLPYIPPKKIAADRSTPVLNSLESSLKLVVGGVLTTIGTAGTIAVFPLAITGRLVGTTLGNEVSKQEGNIAPDKETVTWCTAIASLGFSAIADSGTKIIEKESRKIKENIHEYKHIDSSDLQHAFIEYKKGNEALKAEFREKKAELSNYRDDRPDLIAPKIKEMNDIRKQLNERKQFNPLRLHAIEQIFNELDSKNLSQSERIQLKSEVKSAVFKTTKNSPQVMDMRGNGFFIISKGSLGDSHVIEVAKKGNIIGEGTFGVVSKVHYLHEQKKGSEIRPQAIKIAKIGKDPLEDIQFEIENLDNVGGGKGIQNKPTVRFTNGYISEEMEGAGKSIARGELTFNSSKKEVKVKERMTWELVAGVKELKRKGLFQSDFKPGNTLFKGKKLVVSDFGGVRAMREKVKISNLRDSRLPVSVKELFSPNGIPPKHVTEEVWNKLDAALLDAQRDLKLLMQIAESKKDAPNFNPDRVKILEMEIIKNFNTKVQPLLYPDKQEILKIKSLPNNVRDLFPTKTYIYISAKVWNRLDRELVNTKASLKELEESRKIAENNDPLYDSYLYEQRRLLIIKEFNNKAEPLLYGNVEFALGLTLYSVWTQSDPPLNSFAGDRPTFSTLNSAEYSVMAKNLKDSNVPANIQTLILNSLKIGLEDIIF